MISKYRVLQLQLRDQDCRLLSDEVLMFRKKYCGKSIVEKKKKMNYFMIVYHVLMVKSNILLKKLKNYAIKLSKNFFKIAQIKVKEILSFIFKILPIF